ncbi:MAG: glycosyltransferase, partial [Gammaproteobacteria bacterium]|nr:glycosyltransferase [Gammaproteobacteria bacterium]
MQQSVSVVIVNYNGGPLLSECVQSVLDSTVPVEVFVSDNASRDASLIELRMRLGNDPRLTIIENPTNLGFAKANNLAFRHAP